MPARSPSRREWLASASGMTAASLSAQTPGPDNRPNIVLVISDQFRSDCVGAMGLNPMNLTPNLDRMASRGVLFESAFSSNPVCAPARGSIFTGQYPSRHGVWHNGVALPENATTLATTLTQAGYSANYIGKWHLAGGIRTPVPARLRGGFSGLWEASDELEWTSHAYEGDIFDNDGKAIHFSGQYRADFLTSRAQRFLRSAKAPFLLVVSYLEVHHQNDSDTYDPPKEFARRYPNPFVPPDLRPLPGSWPSQLSDYFGCVAKMDETVGVLRRTLEEAGHARDTIFGFLSDHGCHFRTRNPEYKRSPHESSIHIPLIIEGPGFRPGVRVPELVSLVDVAPTLIDAAGLDAPPPMQGRSMLPLVEGRRDGWRNEVYFELSEFVTGRGLRTPQYTYAAVAPKQPGWEDAREAERYVDYVLYDLYADPSQHVNLAGRVPYQKTAGELRARLADRIREAGGGAAAIDPSWFPYS